MKENKEQSTVEQEQSTVNQEQSTVDEQTNIELEKTIGVATNKVKPIQQEVPEVQEEIEISSKIKTRSDYISTIKDVCNKLNKDPPIGLHRQKLKELKEILASVTSEGVEKVQGIEPPPTNKDDYAVVLLYNLNKMVLTLAENLSTNYENKLGFRCVNVVKKMETNEEQKQALKDALRGVYLEYKDEIEPLLSPIAVLALMNLSILTQSIERIVVIKHPEDSQKEKSMIIL